MVHSINRPYVGPPTHGRGLEWLATWLAPNRCRSVSVSHSSIIEYARAPAAISPPKPSCARPERPHAAPRIRAVRIRAVHGTSADARRWLAMPDFPIDPVLRIRARPTVVLRRTTEALAFIRKVALSTHDRAWEDILQSFEAARDEWSAMEAIVHLELRLETEGLLIEEGRSGQGRSLAA
jgi:hypothetical protein